MNTTIAPQAKHWEEAPCGTTSMADFSRFVPKLVAALQNDFTVGEACEYAGLPRRTYYNYVKAYPEFAEEMRKAKNFPKILAKKRVMHIILNGSDKDAGPMVRWFLEKREPETYGKNPTVIQNNQQNNYFLSDEEARKFAQEVNLSSIDPTELLEYLEEPKPQKK